MGETSEQLMGVADGRSVVAVPVKKRTRAYISVDPATGTRSVVMLSSRSEGGPYLFGPFKVNAAAEWVAGQFTAGAHFPSARFAEREYERFKREAALGNVIADFQPQV